MDLTSNKTNNKNKKIQFKNRNSKAINHNSNCIYFAFDSKFENQTIKKSKILTTNYEDIDR